MFKRLLLLISILPIVILSTAAAAQQTIVVVGDSLSAAYGMTQKEGWVNLLALRLKAEQRPYQVINTSISGETSYGARTRIKEILKAHQPSIVIIAIGANDGLRGLSLKAMKENIALMIEKAQAQQSLVLLAGMQLPPNYGRKFAARFANSYQQLAQQYNVALLPFLLKGMEQDLSQFQRDGIHPLNSAQSSILDNVWSQLQPLLQGNSAVSTDQSNH